MMHATFAEFASVLQGSASSVEAAEGHGCLCGALCSGPDYTLERWLDELIATEDRVLSEGDARLLQLVFDETQHALRGHAMEFAPLLPEEEDRLEHRAAAMSQWARGFLYGFGTGGVLPAGAISENVDEVLRDIAQIGSAAVDVGAAGEEEEAAYTEVYEYLRVSVQLVHDELASVREGGTSKPTVPENDDEPLSTYGNDDEFNDAGLLPDDELH